MSQSLAVYGLANVGCVYAICGESLRPPAAADGRATSLHVWHSQEHSSDA